MSETTRDIVIKVQAQAARIASDLESEKKVRADSHSRLNNKLDEISNRLQKLNNLYYLAVGILIAIQAMNAFGFFDYLKPTNNKNQNERQNNESTNHADNSGNRTNRFAGLRNETGFQFPGFASGLFGISIPHECGGDCTRR